MTLFRRGGVAVEARNAWDDIAELIRTQRFGSSTYAGESVNDDSAMRLAAVWACVDLLSELVSTLPVDEFMSGAGGVSSPVSSSKFLLDPAGNGTGFEVWARQVMTSALIRGNAFGFVTGLDRAMWPTQIEVLHPDRIKVRRELTFGPVDWYLDDKAIDLWPAGPLWHFQAYPWPGSPVGMSPIRYAAQTIGTGLAVQKFGAQWFGDGAHPTHAVEGEHEISQSQATVLKQRIMAHTADNGREPLLLGGGFHLKPMQVSPEESQFLETSKATADDVARFFFRRPPGEGGQVTYANVEARSLDMLTYTVNPWLVRLERALTRLRPRPRFVKFNPDALVRVDLASRYKAHDMSIRSGWRSVNEVRKVEDMASIDDGDRYLWPPGSTVPTGPPSPDAAEGGDQ